MNGPGDKRVIALRGATTVESNDRTHILEATRELLDELCRRNGFGPEHVISGIFTLTPDLNAAFPAEAARMMGWATVALMCAREIGVPGALPRCIRVLLHLTVPAGADAKHVYLGRAAKLRPDLTGGIDSREDE